MAKGNTKRLFKVVGNGAETHAMPKRKADALARQLREGRCGRRGGLLKVEATVVAA